jgi:hypothetical protein
MRRALALTMVLAAAAGAAAWFVLGPARAQDAVSPAGTLYVSGLHIGGKSARAVVRLVNTSTHLSDQYRVRYTVQATGAGEALSLPGAGPDGAVLGAGRVLELDLGAIVNRYRATIGVGPYSGPVRFVAFGDRGAYSNFGPATVHASVVQTEGAARFEPLVEWR